LHALGPIGFARRGLRRGRRFDALSPVIRVAARTIVSPATPLLHAP
jgi:hypothetical protein